MILKKADKIKYLGFDDKWFMTIGILILAWITNYLFSDNLTDCTPLELLGNYSISVFFSTLNWSIMRGFMIYLRKKLPAFKDNTKRVALVLLFIIGTPIFVNYVGNLILQNAIGLDFHPVNTSRIIIPILLISTMVIAIYEAIYFYVRLQQVVRDEEKNKRAIVQSKLDALQNQSRPHFLFNSLNTLRDIIDNETKEDAKKFVDKLSNVYRFILDADSKNMIPLSKEIQFSKSYLHIQKERFGDNLITSWNIPNMADQGMIAPMSLQILLENAIKHNVISKANPLQIDINLENEYLIVKNKIQLKTTQVPSTKIGLSNIIDRYELLSEKPVLISNQGNHFEVSIPLLHHQVNS